MERDFCYECKKLLESLNDAIRDKRTPDPNHAGVRLLYKGPHHTSMTALRVAATSGCGMCSKLEGTFARLYIKSFTGLTVTARYSHHAGIRLEFGHYRAKEGAVSVGFNCVPIPEKEEVGGFTLETFLPLLHRDRFYRDG